MPFGSSAIRSGSTAPRPWRGCWARTAISAHLDLVNTLIGKEGLAALVDALVQEDYPLERLYLSGNFLDESAAGTLAKLLLENRHLQEIYLSVNRLGDSNMLLTK